MQQKKLNSKQPRPQGLLLDDFQNGGSSGEDPGIQQKSRDRLVYGGSQFIQNGGQDKEWEDLDTKSGDWWKTNKMAAKANSYGSDARLNKEAKSKKECM